MVELPSTEVEPSLEAVVAVPVSVSETGPSLPLLLLGPLPAAVVVPSVSGMNAGLGSLQATTAANVAPIAAARGRSRADGRRQLTTTILHPKSHVTPGGSARVAGTIAKLREVGLDAGPERRRRRAELVQS